MPNPQIVEVCGEDNNRYFRYWTTELLDELLLAYFQNYTHYATVADDGSLIIKHTGTYEIMLKVNFHFTVSSKSDCVENCTIVLNCRPCSETVKCVRCSAQVFTH